MVVTAVSARLPQPPATPPVPRAETAEAAQRIFDENLPWALKIARSVIRKLPPSFESDDVLQEARIELWRRAQLYQENNGRPGKDPNGTPFQAYAYLAVRGACLMSVRRKNWTEAQHLALESASAEDEHSLVPEPASPTPDPETQLAKKRERKNITGPREYRRRRWLLKQIDRLAPVDAHLIKATYIEERDLAELAKLQGVDRTVLSRRLAGIVKRLKQARRKTSVVSRAKPQKETCMDVDYSVVVADLEAKQNKIDAAIAGLEKLKVQRAGVAAALAAVKKMVAAEASGKAPAKK